MTGLLVFKLFLSGIFTAIVSIITIVATPNSAHWSIKLVLLVLFFGGLITIPVTILMGIWLL